MALAEGAAQVLGVPVGVVVQAAARGVGDGVDDLRVGEVGAGGLREVERGHAGQGACTLLGGALAQALVDLLVGHALELLVVVEQAHGAYPPGEKLGAGPCRMISQNMKMLVPMTQVVANTREMIPLRWS